MNKEKRYHFLKRNRLAVLLLVLALVMAGFSACGSADSGSAAEESGALKVVATVFPAYDWTREVIGDNTDNVDLTLLMDSGTDLHNYQPSAEDILTIGQCDVFIYIGGESDEWVEDALAQAQNADMVVINLMEQLGDAAREEEIKEGMQEEEHEHKHDADEEHEDGDADHEDEEEGPEYDEHIWLSLKNAQTLVQIIAASLGEADPAGSDSYKANADAYCEQLAALDAQYQEAVDSAARKVLLFADRFPFRYLTEDYGLDYYAAFVGCSAETEASFETVSFLAAKTDELGLPAVMVIEGSDRKIAETVISNSKNKDRKILVMDSMQSVNAADIEGGVTYLKVMEDDLAVLKEALN